MPSDDLPMYGAKPMRQAARVKGLPAKMRSRAQETANLWANCRRPLKALGPLSRLSVGFDIHFKPVICNGNDRAAGHFPKLGPIAGGEVAWFGMSRKSAPARASVRG